MFDWGSRRRLAYIVSISFFLICFFVVIGILISYKKPNCNDGVKNGDELGVDCGGSCSRVCQNEAENLNIDWARIFKVKQGFYSLVAYVENPNQDFEAENVPYHFKVYDAKDLLVLDEKGTAFVPAGQSFGVFLGGLSVGDRIPTRVIFEWLGKPNWKKSGNQNRSLSIKDISRVIDQKGLSKITAIMQNDGLSAVSNVVGFVVVYDNNGNAIASSETTVDEISAGGSGSMVFSWPEPLNGVVGRVEILHWILPSS